MVQIFDIPAESCLLTSAKTGRHRSPDRAMMSGWCESPLLFHHKHDLGLCINESNALCPSDLQDEAWMPYFQRS